MEEEDYLRSLTAIEEIQHLANGFDDDEPDGWISRLDEIDRYARVIRSCCRNSGL